MADRKAEILGLADELVKTVGYDGFSYADLSAKLGITKATIHHHFPHKEDLGAALCDSYAGWLRGKFAELEALPGPAWGRLEAYFAGGSCGVEDGGRTCPLAALQAQVNTLPEAVRAKLRELDELELAFFARVLEAGRARGELRFAGAPRATAALIVSAYKGALQMARVHGCGFLKDTLAQLKAVLTKEEER